MCTYAPNQYDCNFIADFGFDPVCIAFYVENHSVLAQETRAWIPSLDVCRAGPIRLLNLDDPSVEGTANVSVLFREFCQQSFSH